MNKILNMLTILFFFCALTYTYGQDNSSNIIENITFEELKVITENLKIKEKELIKKEEELSKKEAQLKAYEESLIAKEKELNEIKKSLDELYQKIKITEDENLDHLARVYGSAKAKSAAEVIAKMDLDKAVSLFQRMNPMTAGKILSALSQVDADFASKISERLTPERDKIK